jgi:hypothetical protein
MGNALKQRLTPPTKTQMTLISKTTCRTDPIAGSVMKDPRKKLIIEARTEIDSVETEAGTLLMSFGHFSLLFSSRGQIKLALGREGRSRP